MPKINNNNIVYIQFSKKKYSNNDCIKYLNKLGYDFSKYKCRTNIRSRKYLLKKYSDYDYFKLRKWKHLEICYGINAVDKFDMNRFN